MPDRVVRPLSLSARARSPRALASAVALALAALSGSASAAGLGRLTVQSSLGQPLRAEVEVTSVGSDEAATLAARLASAEAFRRAGLEFGPTQQNLRFGVERRGEGRYVVRITSSQAINEPFVDLLVELNSSGGRFVREYTFLLDPPELRSAQQAVTASQQDAGVVAPVGPGVRVEAAPSTRMPAPASAAPQAAGAQATAGEAITVQRGDTLAAIARRVRPADASVEQTAAALYRANPGAFGGSPDLLRAGATLKVPEAASIAAVDAAQARRELRMRAQDFQSYRDRLAAAPRQTEPAQAGQSVTGRIGASVEDRAAPAERTDQLRLSRGAGGAAAAGAAGSQASRAAAAEQRYARDAALSEVDARMRQLERNLSDLQKLVELKDQSLATMQRQLEEARASSARTPAAARADAGASRQAASAATDASASPAAASEGAAASSATPVPATPAGDATATPVAGAAPGEADGKAAEALAAATAAPTRPQVAASAPATAPAPTAPTASESLLDNPYLLPGLGGLALLGAGYAWLAVRRRRQAERQDEEAVAGEPFAGGAAFAAVDDPQDVQDAQAGHAAPQAVDTQATEVDPIAEAEVYIAYGREQQAEEILREALRQQPDRQPVRAKLLEIYAGRQDAIGFGELAGEMYVATQGLNPEWPQVASWGRSIDPDNPLYASGEDAAVPGDALPDADSPASAEPFVAGAGVDRDAASTPAASAQASPPDEEVAALDFELDLDTAIGRAGDRLAAEAQPIEAIMPVSRQPSELARAVGGDFELPSLDLDEIDTADATPAAAARATAEPALEIDLSGISLDLEPVTLTDQGGDSARWQEMTTKLDLAAAYDEIGDREGARELLDEVMRDGDAQQQQRARSMLASFA